MVWNILVPAAVLAIWSMVMLIWMAATRFPSMAKSDMDFSNLKPGGRGVDLEGVLPSKVMWKAHNYNHLMEQPTVFYATVFILFLTGPSSTFVLSVAWLYVAIRIVHSIWQATVNLVPVRLSLFVASSICLTILSVRALLAALNLPPIS